MAKKSSKKQTKNKSRAKSKKKRGNHPRPSKHELSRPIAAPLSTETRAADAVTVFWLLTGFSAAMAELAWCVLRVSRGDFEDTERWLALHGVVAAIALLTGFVTLAMTAIAIRVRRAPPPNGVITAMVLVGVTPCAALIIAWLRS